MLFVQISRKRKKTKKVKVIPASIKGAGISFERKRKEIKKECE